MKIWTSSTFFYAYGPIIYVGIDIMDTHAVDF